ncbi:MAG: UDP-N-acetylglucosamine 2-epimerase (non-hydrolyzing), partial [Planctomycetales bacterium]
MDEPLPIDSDAVIACIVGARPNFVKIAPVMAALAESPGIRATLIHTGQHYDQRMSDVFFEQLGIPQPDVSLGVGSGTHGEQTAGVLRKYEAWLLEQPRLPAATLVVGDVNSTVACALASVKLGVPVAHLEAGLRSFDRTMPEEINRVVTDAVSELLLVSEPSGVQNLLAEGRPESAIKLVGNIMIDSLFSHLDQAGELKQPEKLGLSPDGYILWTMHRPSNVDDPAMLSAWTQALILASRSLPVLFPVHPRTRARLQAAELFEKLENAENVTLTEPLGYLEFLGL